VRHHRFLGNDPEFCRRKNCGKAKDALVHTTGEPLAPDHEQVQRLLRVVERTGWWTASDGIPDIYHYLRARATELAVAMQELRLTVATKSEVTSYEAERKAE
jgi:hypothetical protein